MAGLERGFVSGETTWLSGLHGPKSKPSFNPAHKGTHEAVLLTSTESTWGADIRLHFCSNCQLQETKRNPMWMLRPNVDWLPTLKSPEPRRSDSTTSWWRSRSYRPNWSTTFTTAAAANNTFTFSPQSTASLVELNFDTPSLFITF